MRSFKVITAVGGVPSLWLRKTLDSIALQKWDDYNVCVVVDHGENMGNLTDVARDYAAVHGWEVLTPHQRLGPVHNQYDAIAKICSDPEDVVVWLDGDGDEFVHSNVFKSLDAWYQHGYVLTYGSFRAYPDSPTSLQARPYPQQVIETNSYRQFARSGGGICHNHLRTMKYRLIQQMELSDFLDSKGHWLMGAADSVFMFPGLELSRGNHVCIPEILVNYHADHVGSEWKRKDNASDLANHVILAEKQPK